ncbi:MAG: glycoside hydrolase N-terminal domain-containing protein [Candidatus Hydrogenedentes bacterium]|nr:glycoside hydrolase N-terminal domain-containing protein [Candidatus Hydrogenedentota bacterium]
MSSCIILSAIVTSLGAGQAVGEGHMKGETLWCAHPAGTWTEALPLGNGRLGAMVFGGVPQEHLQLNEESLWAGEPVDVYPENFKENFTEVQRLVLEGKITEARAFGLEHLTQSPTSFRSYESLADLWLEMDHGGEVSEYRPDLLLNTGLTTTRYTVRELATTPGQTLEFGPAL